MRRIVSAPLALGASMAHLHPEPLDLVSPASEVLRAPDLARALFDVRGTEGARALPLSNLSSAARTLHCSRSGFRHFTDPASSD